MANGGQAAIRGYLVQTLIALLDALDGESEWRSVTLEPNVESDKVDILWEYPRGAKAVQVKSSKNPFRKADVERYAMELESWREADEYELLLVGTPASASVAKIGRVGKVSVPSLKNLDLRAFSEQAAHRLEGFLRNYDLEPGDANYRIMLAAALTEKLAALSTVGHPLTRPNLLKLLKKWIPPKIKAESRRAQAFDNPQLIRVFVSSPGDVAEERAVLDEVIARINRTDGEARGVRLDLWKWETNVVPQIGLNPQSVIDGQLPPFDIYLGIMKHRFGTPTGKHGSGTEKEFQDALRRWGKVGSPWILFYFDEGEVKPTKLDLDQYIRVRQFQEKLKKKGLYATYEGVRGSNDAFYEKADEHLRKILQKVAPLTARHPDPSGQGPDQKPIVLPEYTRWLCDRCGELELMGLHPKHGVCVLLDHVYTPLVTSASADPERTGRSSAKRPEEQMELLAERREAPQLLLKLLDGRSLYVSGEPGSGKSTFCRWVTWLTCNGTMPAVNDASPEAYRETFPEQLRDRLPVLVPLRDFWGHLPPSGVRSIGLAGLERALEQWLMDQKASGMSPGCLGAHLKEGSALIMLDGIDEVPPMSRSNGQEWYPREMLLDVLVQAVKQWTGAGNRMLVTSRPYGLDTRQLRRLGLQNAPIQAMDRELQALLVRRWFALLSLNREDGSGTAEAMIDHLRGAPGLDELAANPLLLTAMCIIYDEGKRLPADKHELYDRIVDTVLHKRYPLVKERVSEVRGRLGVIAWGMHTGEGLGQQRAFPEASVSQGEIDLVLQGYHKLDGATDTGLLDTVRVREDLLSQSGLLLPKGDGLAEFYHLSFQEFAAAERMFLLFGRDQARLMEQLLRRAESSNWRNTLSFVFGCLVSKFSPHAGVELLQKVVDGMVLPAVDPANRGQGGGAWNQAIVLGDCLEILLGRRAAVPAPLSEFFVKAAMQAIDQEIAVKGRQRLAVVLGRLGDPRIDADLRVQSGPDKHQGYVRIPAGEYRYGKKKERFTIDEPFWLARYPVTNLQFKAFIKDGGYRRLDIWSEEGRRWREENKIGEPGLWHNPEFSSPNQPVVGVSFWEAEAFAAWAGGSLPTEHQWEAAARGPDGFEYPWGDEWEDGICNSREAGLGGTSVVGIFPRSRSRSLGLEDMAGNVWEWCSTTESSDRVFRGGGWLRFARVYRAAFRVRGVPWGRLVDLGFRVALVPAAASGTAKTGMGKVKRPKPGTKAEGAKRRSPPTRGAV